MRNAGPSLEAINVSALILSNNFVLNPKAKMKNVRTITLFTTLPAALKPYSLQLVDQEFCETFQNLKVFIVRYGAIDLKQHDVILKCKSLEKIVTEVNLPIDIVSESENIVRKSNATLDITYRFPTCSVLESFKRDQKYFVQTNQYRSQKICFKCDNIFKCKNDPPIPLIPGMTPAIQISNPLSVSPSFTQDR